MKIIFGYLIFILLINWSISYNTQTEQRRHFSAYESKPQQLCCTGGIILTSWALSHYKDVRAVANIMRQQYFTLTQGGQITNNYAYPSYGGKSQEELSTLVKQHVEYIINEIQSGRIAQNLVTQTNFFEQEAASFLERLEHEENLYIQQQNQQQHQVILENERPSYDEVESLNTYNGVKQITYPTEVHMIGDKTYIMKKNCTTSTDITPITTILGTNEMNSFNESYTQSHHTPIRNPFLERTSSSHSIYNYLNKHETSHVPNWSPQVIIDERTNNHYAQTNTPAVVIPVASNVEQHSETYNTQNLHSNNNFQTNYFDTDSLMKFENEGSIGHTNLHTYQPSGHSTVTIKHYNRTIYTGADGRPIVQGGESETRIDNGQVVFNNYRPFGSSSIYEEDWKKSERERLFWLFQNRMITNEELSRWQSQQEERLHSLAYHYNTTIEEIEEWQRQELNRFNTVVHEQSLVSENLEEWQKKENTRLRWLIEQNSLTRTELENWQRRNQNLLMSLANEYRISISQLKEWQKQQLEQLYEALNFQTTELDTLKQWQNQERDRLHTVIQQHNITVEELQEQIRRDQHRLENLSQQYHVNIAEMEKWLKNELNRLTLIVNQQQEEIKRLTEWQKQERLRLEQITREHNLTVEELTQQLKHDKNYLNNLAHKYHISIEELEAWQRKEIDRLHNIGTINIENQLKEWQQRERDRLMVIAQQNDYTIEEFEKKIRDDRIKLQTLADQYQVRVEEVEEWIKKESNRLHSQGLLKNVEEELNEWQTRERDRLLTIVKQNEINVEELEKRIKNDNQYLHNLAFQYQIQVKEVEEWVRKEIERLKAQGLVKIDTLEEWQKSERQRLNQFISQNQLTIEEFEQSVLKDKSRLQNLAFMYHVQLEELETFIKNEINRLKVQSSQNIGELKQWQEYERKNLEKIVLENHLTLEELKRSTLQDRQYLQNLAIQYHTNLNEIEIFIINEINRLQNLGFVKVTEEIIEEREEVLSDWQKTERDNLLSLVAQNYVTVDELEQKIKNDRYRLEKLAYDYQITVEEIEEWYKNEIQELLKQNLIHEVVRLTEWQRQEREYLQKLISQQSWSIEELERKLKQNHERINNIMKQYQITIQQLIDWYNKELIRLQDTGVIYSENLTQWQSIEKDRLYVIVTQQLLTINQLEKILWDNKESLKYLAQNYQITVHELKEFQRYEIDRLSKLGLLSNRIESALWEKEEQTRLRLIAKEFLITEEELLEFLRYDRDFHVDLAKKYGTTVEILENYQTEELKRIQNEGKFDRTQLINLQTWQKRERDRLFILILNQQITRADLIKWQSNLENLQNIAHQYNIHVDELRKWQLFEFNRLSNLARYYRMSLIELAEFRQSELDRLRMLAHSVAKSNEEYSKWLQLEKVRFNLLSERYRLTAQSLEKWRRTLFLLCQGLIYKNFDENTGQMLDNRYNTTGRYNVTISSDRGDQPPNVFVEDYDDHEPNVYGHKPTTAPVQEREPTTSRPAYQHVRPAPLQTRPVNTGSAITDTYGRTYRKKVTTYTAPVVINENTDISASSSYKYNSPVPAVANVHYGGHYQRNTPEKYTRSIDPTESDSQYEQKRQNEEILDLDTAQTEYDGQQRLMDLKPEDFGQQHLVQTHIEESNVQKSNLNNLQQASFQNYNETKDNKTSVAVDAEQVEAQVEEQPSGFWGKVKKKTKDFFG